MRFRLFLEAIESGVPPAPGTTPIPPGHVRLYHYFSVRNAKGQSDEDLVNSVKKDGLDIKRAKGSQYGEPNAVWASSQMPERGHRFVEFDMPVDDPRWIQMVNKDQATADRLNKNGGNFSFAGSIRPEEIIAVHLPWHGTYRYLVSHNMIPRVLAGEFDNLLDDPDSPEAKAIKYIKSNKSTE